MACVKVDPPNGSESRLSVLAAYENASDERSYNTLKVRSCATLGEEPEVEAEASLMEACDSQNTKRLELRFRALLTEGGAERLELASVWTQER
jgi:hypothetical protein